MTESSQIIPFIFIVIDDAAYFCHGTIILLLPTEMIAWLIGEVNKVGLK